MANVGDTDGHVIFAVKRIAKSWDEATLVAGVLHAGLRIVGNAPGRAIEGDNHSRFGDLKDFAVVGCVGLAGDNEDFAEADVGDGGFSDRLSVMKSAHLQLVEATRSRGE